MAGTVYTKPVTIDAPEKVVVFDGVDFIENAHIVIKNAKEVTFKNCRFYKLTPTAAKTYPVKLEAEAAVKLVIEKCFFGNNPSVDKKTIYNLLELTGKLLDGSSVSNNYFCKDCCTHNPINVYNVEDGAVINLNGNHAEYSANLIRIGTMGEPKDVTINCYGNRYDGTDGDADWAGLLLIQPYGNKTTSFNGLTVNIGKTVNNTGAAQLYYVYAAGSDTRFNYQTNYPTVVVDGVVEDELVNRGKPIEGEKPVDPEETQEDETQETAE